MSKYRVRVNFSVYQPKWTREKEELFGPDNEGFLIEGNSAKEAFNLWNEGRLPGARLNPFYLKITEEPKKNPRKRLSRQSVIEAAANYQFLFGEYGEHDQGTQRAFVLWKDLQKQYERQTGKPMYQMKKNPRKRKSAKVSFGHRARIARVYGGRSHNVKSHIPKTVTLYRPKKNPGKRIKAPTGRHPEFVKQSKYEVQQMRRHRKLPPEKRYGKQNPKYFTQVKRGKRWITLGSFSMKVYAEDYGRSLAVAYPHQQFRVFWE